MQVYNVHVGLKFTLNGRSNIDPGDDYTITRLQITEKE